MHRLRHFLHLITVPERKFGKHAGKLSNVWTAQFAQNPFLIPEFNLFFPADIRGNFRWIFTDALYNLPFQRRAAQRILEINPRIFPLPLTVVGGYVSRASLKTRT